MGLVSTLAVRNGLHLASQVAIADGTGHAEPAWHVRHGIFFLRQPCPRNIDTSGLDAAVF
jgi:hypothetical protein